MSFRTATFGEICEFKYGKSLAASSRIPGDAVVYGSNGPVGTHSTPLSDGPTIVIGRKGSVGEVHYCGGPNWAIDTTYFIDATSTDCDLKWLSYALSASRIRQLNKAAAIPGLNRNDAYRESVLVPSLDEQKRIAAILDKADQLRQKRRQAIAQLDSLTQSIFLEMFGHITNTVQLMDVCNRITDGTHQAPNWSTDGIPFLFVSNIRNQAISFESNKYVSKEEYSRLTKNCRIEAGDVLYTAVGSYGHAAVVPLGRDFIFQRHIAHIKPKIDQISPQFLAFALESTNVRQQADRVARGVAQKTVTLASLREFVIPIPNIDKQKLFEHKISKVRQLAFSEQFDHLNSFFSSLQHRAFSGQL